MTAARPLSSAGVSCSFDVFNLLEFIQIASTMHPCGVVVHPLADTELVRKNGENGVNLIKFNAMLQNVFFFILLTPISSILLTIFLRLASQLPEVISAG
jgi:hypothetical protein